MAGQLPGVCRAATAGCLRGGGRSGRRWPPARQPGAGRAKAGAARTVLGSADLTGSNLTHFPCRPAGRDVGRQSPGVPGAGVRHGCADERRRAARWLLPHGGTFLTFSDHSRNAIRMAALMKQRVIRVFTHDSIAGRGRPTHQSIEQVPLAAPLIPGLDGGARPMAWRRWWPGPARCSTDGPARWRCRGRTCRGCSTTRRSAEVALGRLCAGRCGAGPRGDRGHRSEVSLAMQGSGAAGRPGHRGARGVDAQHQRVRSPAAGPRGGAAETRPPWRWRPRTPTSGAVKGRDGQSSASRVMASRRRWRRSCMHTSAIAEVVATAVHWPWLRRCLTQPHSGWPHPSGTTLRPSTVIAPSILSANCPLGGRGRAAITLPPAPTGSTST